MWGHCIWQNCKSTSYSEPNPKSKQPNPTAGGRFQTIQTIKVHQNLDWESVQNCESWDCEENDTTTNAYNYSGDRDCCSRPYWLWWVCANLQCSKAEHWAVNCEIVNFNKLWKTVKINILEELTFFTLKCHFEDFEENLIFDSKTLIARIVIFFSCCYFECLFSKFQEISGNWFSGMWFVIFVILRKLLIIRRNEPACSSNLKLHSKGMWRCFSEF